jgi:hypothetical protein
MQEITVVVSDIPGNITQQQQTNNVGSEKLNHWELAE